MADTSRNPSEQVGKGGKGQKILGMPRTTGIIVIGLGALVVGYFVVSHFTKSNQQGQGQGGQGKGGGQGGYWWGSGQGRTVEVVRGWQGHHHHQKVTVPPKQ